MHLVSKMPLFMVLNMKFTNELLGNEDFHKVLVTILTLLS